MTAIEQALLQAVTPAQSWSDIVIRAELMQYHRRSMLGTWAHIDNERRSRDCSLLIHRSFAELLTAVLEIGGVPRPPRGPCEELLLVDEPNVDDEFEDDDS